MDFLFEIISLIICIASFWLGLKKIDVSKVTAWILGFVEIALTIVSIYQLGSIGIWIIIVANVLGILSYSGWLAMRKESILVNASIQGKFEREEVENLYDELPELNKVFKYIGPLKRAELIQLISQRGRSIDEIRKLIVPIALIYVVQELDLKTLVDKFDRLLRLWDKPASEAMQIADQLTAGTQNSASTFEEMLDAMIAFQDPGVLDS